EDRGRRTHRAVMRSVEERVEDVAPCAGGEHEPAAEARAERPAHGGHEDRARDRVGEEVGRVRVQGERRHRAPRLAAHDQLGRGAPGPGPRTARVRRPRDAVEGDEQHGDENPDVRPSVLRRLRGRGCAPPLGIVPVQRRNGPVGVARRHEEAPLPRARGDAMGDARGGEDESPLLDRAPLARGTTPGEWKGVAYHYSIAVTGRTAENAVWSYPAPAAGYETIADHVAFYPARVDACYLDGERVRAQEGDLYGGWITRDVIG